MFAYGFMLRNNFVHGSAPRGLVQFVCKSVFWAATGSGKRESASRKLSLKELRVAGAANGASRRRPNQFGAQSGPSLACSLTLWPHEVGAHWSSIRSIATRRNGKGGEGSQVGATRPVVV